MENHNPLFREFYTFFGIPTLTSRLYLVAWYNKSMNRDPYIMLAELPKFSLSSNDIADNQRLSSAQLGAGLGGKDVSPHLKWSNFPEETKSFAVTAYDPDAPTPSGFWHWAVFNIPSSTTELVQNAGSKNSTLPDGAIALRNDRGTTSFIGAAPPVGTGKHRYFFVVYALDIERLELPADITPAFLTFNLKPHTLAWASITPWYEQA